MSLGALNLNGYKLTYMRTSTAPFVSVPQTDPVVTFRSATLNSGANELENNTSVVLVLQGASGTGGLTKTGTGTLVLSDQPNQGSANAILTSGVVTSVGLGDNPLKGFTGTPIVRIAPPMNSDGTPVVGGAQATASATVVNGVITLITVNSGGSGYLSSPQVTVTPNNAVTVNTYNGGTSVQGGKLNLSGSSSSSISLASGTTLELNYQAPSEATASLDSDVSTMPLKGITLVKSFAGYTVPPTVTIGAPQNLDGSLIANGVAATATAQVLNGRIVGLTITSPGSGYTLAQRPNVTIAPPQEGTVVATTTGSITFETGVNLSVNNPPIGTGVFRTLLTADGGIGDQLPSLLNLPGYTLTKSDDGKSLILTDNREGPTFTGDFMATQISYGQSLASSALSGVSTRVAGSFAWKTAGTLLPVGTSSQIVTFTPNDPTTYRPAEFTVSVTVNKANPVTSFPTAGTITYGQALSAVTLADGTGAGSYAFASPATIPNAGLTQDFEVTFTPSVPANYNTVTQIVSVTVNKATPTVSVPPTASAVTVGALLSSSTLGIDGTASVPGTFAWTDSSAVVNATDSYLVTFTPTDGANYNTASTSASVTANPATPAGTTYNDWLTANGGTASDAAFLDYVFGAATVGALDPSLKPTVAVTNGNLVLTYYVRKGTLGLTVTPELSLNLGDANGGFAPLDPTLIEYLETSNFGEVSVERRTARVPVSGAKKFLRIKAEQL
jgi:hypothetical protein